MDGERGVLEPVDASPLRLMARGKRLVGVFIGGVDYSLSPAIALSGASRKSSSLSLTRYRLVEIIIAFLVAASFSLIIGVRKN